MIRNKLLQHTANLFRKNEINIHELTYLFWECTLRCNLQCLHCGSDCTSNAKAEDMPFDDFLKAILPIKEIYKPETITVVITGGEPLLRKDLPKCGRILHSAGFNWGIVTNGFNYNEDIHNSLLKAGMGSITISLDGLETSHNWLRTNNQSFDRAVRALELIVSCDQLVYDVVTCVNQVNIDELEQLKNFLIEKKVEAWRLFTIAPIGRAEKNHELQLNPLQLKKLMDFIAKARIDKEKMQVTFSCEAYVGEYERRVRDTFFFCRAGVQIASVLIDGSISACPNINRYFIQGNIYHDKFLDVWENRFQIMRDRSWTRTGHCLHCRDYRNCMGGAMHLWDEKKDSIKTCIYQQLLLSAKQSPS